MRTLLIGTAALAAATVATPAAAQIYVGIGQSPYSYPSYGYGYSYPAYGYSSYGSYPSYGYSYPGYGYSYPSYGYSSYGSYPNYGYGYSYPGYGYSSYGYSSYSTNNPCIHKHHRNGVVYYTRSC